MASRAGDQGDGARRPRHPRDGLRRGALAGGAPRARCGPRAGETAQDPGDPGRGRAGGAPPRLADLNRSEEHTSELQSRLHLVCRLLLEKKKKYTTLQMAEIYTGTAAIPASRGVHTGEPD